ncbi:hypothetical protein D3C80_2001360 [compost metagenome]
MSPLALTHTKIEAGSAHTEHTAVAVSPVRLPLCAVVMIVTPPTRWRIAFRKILLSTGGSACSMGFFITLFIMSPAKAV